MITPITVVARASAPLTGGGTVDYCANLDMTQTRDGQVTIEIAGTKGGLQSIDLAFLAGINPDPTSPISLGTGILTESINDDTWSRSVTIFTSAHYVRAAVAGVGVHPEGSDVVVTYHYPPNVDAMVVASKDGVLKITT